MGIKRKSGGGEKGKLGSEGVGRDKKVPKLPPDPTEPLFVAKRIVVGSIAERLPRGETSSATHKWTAYVRGVHGEDVSKFIRRVTFQLDPSFSKPQRIVEAPPFQISEKGWGEFDIVVTIQLRDGGSPTCLVFSHPLKLYHVGDKRDSKKPVVSEKYDEIIFTMVSEQQQKKFIHAARVPESSPHQDHYLKFDDKADIQRLREAQNVVQQEILRLSANYELLKDEAAHLVEMIGERGGNETDIKSIYSGTG
mmetsp:Transcript_7321/g.19005  ORF Transcript_7321/g.19005 Transcript_7321/m.19005 type:complete len:251 (-) Transcript_7321:495-1247(-)|eukprot:CAMPEP_0113902838 /NCGR_PEP_ID=MMETSP0780_2-20120614/22098_1 /TAXON_ID=652834 /ORGANISM="Palpitomonas bilix" /LENGTH=250 /DNA_ID=CAMNT_0000895739 /DNA_START=36 /DNA_END=788 /DNA_ORIENTATION=- /assembly_acc=CAM_ASM_000599